MLIMERESGAPFAFVLGEQFKVSGPFVTNNLSTRKAANWNNLRGPNKVNKVSQSLQGMTQNTDHSGTSLEEFETKARNSGGNVSGVSAARRRGPGPNPARL